MTANDGCRCSSGRMGYALSTTATPRAPRGVVGSQRAPVVGGLTQMASAVVEAAPVTVAPSLQWLTGQQVDAALLMKADDC